jgi:hypothetical protein
VGRLLLAERRECGTRNRAQSSRLDGSVPAPKLRMLTPNRTGTSSLGYHLTVVLERSA